MYHNGNKYCSKYYCRRHFQERSKRFKHFNSKLFENNKYMLLQSTQFIKVFVQPLKINNVVL